LSWPDNRAAGNLRTTGFPTRASVRLPAALPFSSLLTTYHVLAERAARNTQEIATRERRFRENPKSEQGAAKQRRREASREAGGKDGREEEGEDAQEHSRGSVARRGG